MGWQKITFYSEGFSHEKVSAIQDAFVSAWAPKGAPKEAAIYITKGLLPLPKVCEVYLNPMAAEIAKVAMIPFSPEPVEPPDMTALEISVFNHGGPSR
jgi:hypothetical protein